MSANLTFFHVWFSLFLVAVLLPRSFQTFTFRARFVPWAKGPYHNCYAGRNKRPSRIQLTTVLCSIKFP